MKKLIICFTMLIAASSILAQTNKGQVLLGASLAGVSYTNSESKTSYSNTPTVYKSTGTSASFSFNPTIGWFIQNNLAIGSLFSISFYSSKSTSSNSSSSATSDYTSTQPSYYLGPFARLYFGGGEKGKAFIHVGGQWGIYGGTSKSNSSSGSSSETKTIPKEDWNAGALLGYEQFLNSVVGLYFSFGVNYGKSKTDYDYKPSTGTGYTYTSEYSRIYFPLNVGIQVHLGSAAKKK
jgi:hypothetical protein